MAKLTFETDFVHHPLHYFSLLCVFVLGLWGLFWFNYNPILQVLIVVSLGVAYVVWGIIHHWQHGDLHVKIVFEYILMAVLVGLMFTSIVLRT